MKKIMIISLSLILSTPSVFAMVRKIQQLTSNEREELNKYQNITIIDPERRGENKLLREYVDECIAHDVTKLDATIIGQLTGPLHIAAQSDLDAQILQRCAINLVAHNIPTNNCDPFGNTPLMVACQNRAVINSQILVEYCGETKALDAADKQYRTALHHVCSPTLDSFNEEEISRRFACAQILLKSGANPNVIDKYDRTPLCYVTTSFFGSFTNNPANNTLSKCQYERFMSQRKALMSLLIRHKAQTQPALQRIIKLKETITDDYLIELEHHLKAPLQNHDCNLH